MHRPTTAVLALFQAMAILACQQKSEEVSRSRRFIIGMPMFADDRFGQDQRSSVVSYDGQSRQIFKEVADDNDCCSAYYSAQMSTEPEKLRSVRNNDAWWLAVIENSNRNNEQIQQEIKTKEEWREYQWILSCSQ